MKIFESISLLKTMYFYPMLLFSKLTYKNIYLTSSQRANMRRVLSRDYTRRESKEKICEILVMEIY